MISYFVYTIISLGCSYVLYVLLLRKQKTFQFNRFFLLSALVLCLVAPFLEFELFKAVPSITQIQLDKFTETNAIIDTVDNVTIGEEVIVNPYRANPVKIIYGLISFLFIIRFSKNLLQIYKLTRSEYETIDHLKLIKIQDSNMVSSFFNYIFIPKYNALSIGDYESIIAHETVHSEELHTIDIILLELLSCVFWFNPFIWLYKKAVLQNHEFIADEKSVLSGIDIENYSNTIINLGQKENRVPLTSGFNFIQIKNRIIMLHQSKSSVFKRTLNIISVILLFAGIFVFSSYKDLKEPLVVVIDAGHGGHDSGNLDEKDIVLNISNQLSLLSSDNIRIITTRTEDTFTTLKERVEFINTQNADLVVSLHANAHSNPLTNGVEAYYNDKDEFKDKSYAFGKILLENQMELFSTNRGLKTVPMYIFRHINSPGVFLELGFITNEEDHKVLMNADRQKQIAASIFEGLEEIRKSN
ncbi:N-acetylmuramoyl-L-alanine amidase [Winogradskyella psychrotolerans]|uniref:N-acetylmuramoyl-L-alanine amidase n=1 Tax=Winogradskyella psychrotolerans TaxID=1344585 RepID=UPI001C075FD5|nr:N-acetylmuramoyl-L-alanine amidase [Winogradskyella psychrotolerans]MBU2920815.1 N-acetylmuramoyl-L-alanine amidase [Winogradskyella psychrotolerans]